MKTSRLASGLGWFSIGLGLFELFAAERVGATALRSENPKRRNAALAAGNVAAITALDVLAARQLPV